jgi:hypothetical protein
MPPKQKTLVLLSSLMLAPHAWAQQDMVGPDWLKLLLAFPKLVLYAVGEFALFLAPLFVLLAIVSWLLSRRGGKAASRLPGAPVFAVLAVLTAVPGLIYWRIAPDEPPDPAKSYRSTTVKDRKVDALAPPVGRSWPRETGYLDLPQGAQGGRGVIAVSGRASLHPVYVKLCEAGKQPCPGLRHAYIQKTGAFEFRDLPPGDYEVRYLRVDRPVVGGRSQPIRIGEFAEDPQTVRVIDTPVLDSKNPVVGILPKDF